MSKKLLIALLLIIMLVPLSIAANDNPKALRFDTTYEFRAHLEITGYDERTLTWEGEVFEKGNSDAVGAIQWWMYLDGQDTGQVNHWEDALWIIYPYMNDDEEQAYIMGEEWGSTTWLLHKGAANWQANGFVTDASEGYEYLIGRPMHDGGKVELPIDALPFGEGKIHINK